MKEKYKGFNYYSEDCPVEWDYSEDYEIIVDMDANNVVCMLGEPEDRTYFRDIKPLLNLLNYGGWIKTSETLPSNDVECLIVRNGNRIKSVWNSYHKCWDDNEGDDYLCGPEVPSHWQPLPPFPVEEIKK